MKQKILILASNPRQDLSVHRELDDLVRALKRHPQQKFDITPISYPRSEQLRELFAEEPQIVHFCGHGTGKEGLVFQSNGQKEEIVGTEYLVKLFREHSDVIKCTLLNACDSEHQAKEIVEHIGYVIGMKHPVLDKLAHAYAIGFYGSFIDGNPIEQAHMLGCWAMYQENPQSTQSDQARKANYIGKIVQQLPEHMKPVLMKNSRLLPSELAEINSAPTPEAAEFIRDEIDIKEYFDRTRAAYDDFGKFSAEGAAKPVENSEEYKQRKTLVDKMKSSWIEGFLTPSLEGDTAIRLNLADFNNIANQTEGIEAAQVDLYKSRQRLRSTQIYNEIGQGRTLLILGEAGAGKTIALLQLAQRLLKRSEENLNLPMPVILNLSSWAKEQKKIEDWLVDELRIQYQVSKALSESWIGEQQFMLLLDGLDEVAEEHRNGCVRALNEFIRLRPQMEVAICSRIKDYEKLDERLKISSAICLQSLLPKHIYWYLDEVGGSLKNLEQLLKEDKELEKFAQSPLVLNLMSVACQQLSVEELKSLLGSTSDPLPNLFNKYIDCKLDRGTAAEYSKDNVLGWMSWLASQMVREKQTIFLIEYMQPSWLENKKQQKDYQNRTLRLSFIFGIISSLVFGFFVSNNGSNQIIQRIIAGIVGFIMVMWVCSLPSIVLPEKISWSWKNIKFDTSLIFSISFWGVMTLVSQKFSLEWGLATWFAMVLFFVLRRGIGAKEIEEKSTPNQGIRNSLKNSIVFGLISVIASPLIISIFYGISGRKEDLRIFDWLPFGLLVGLVVALMSGGSACIQHFNLRKTLSNKNRAPWNYEEFLNFVSKRALMRKVGGSYIFFHRMLMEHFAQMYQFDKIMPDVQANLEESSKV